MYQCLLCDVLFDQPALIPVRDWHSEVGAYEEGVREVCPVCGSEEFYSRPEDDVTEER